MLPNLPQHMIALLKILLAASPTSKAKSDSINIISDILPVDVPYVIKFEYTLIKHVFFMRICFFLQYVIF